MASGSVRRGGDRVVESRHLFGLFLGVVVLCGVFFTLGYVMGRTQTDVGFRIASAATRPPSPPSDLSKAERTATAPSFTPEWDVYSPKVPAKPMPGSAPAKVLAAAQPAANPTPLAASFPTKSLAKFKPPLIPRGAIVLQVAALTRDADALALADALQQKHYPAFVLAPSADNFYRVQVGPYADNRSAELAKRALEREGFKTILKR